VKANTATKTTTTAAIITNEAAEVRLGLGLSSIGVLRATIGKAIDRRNCERVQPAWKSVAVRGHT